MDQFVISPLMEGGNMLVTPNVGSNNILVSDYAQGGLSSINTQTFNAGRGGGQDLVIWQNDTQNELIFSTGLSGTGNGGPAGITEAGPGTIVLDATSMYTGATTIDGGTIQIPFAPALGGSTVATNSLVLNGGTLIATGSFALDNNVGTGATFETPVVVGPAGGNITAAAGNTFTVDGNISGPGNLTFGNSSSFTEQLANSQNSVITPKTSVGVGLVVLSGTNTYTGTTTVQAGTLQADGSYTTGNFIVGSGATLGGVPSLPANSSITVQPGGQLYAGNNGVGAITVGTLNLNTSGNVGSSLTFAFNLATAR
jgi:autotransporter-associated beta strand protein